MLSPSILIIGGLFLFGGYVGASFVTNLYLFLLLFGLFPGIGIGICVRFYLT